MKNSTVSSSSKLASMILKIGPKTFSIALVPLALVIAAGAMTVSNLDRLSDSTKWVKHTQNVLAEARTIVASAVDMETGLRGFLLAGQDTFLEPYTSGEALAYKSLSELQETVSDNPPQVARLQEAEQVLRDWQSEVANQAIALRRDTGNAATMDDVADFVAAGHGKVFFDKFRTIMDDFSGIERDLMLLRQADYQEVSSFTRTAIIVATGLAVVVGGALALLIGNNIVSGVRQINSAMVQLADGNIDVDVKGHNRVDEIGEMARALEMFRNSLATVKQEERVKAQEQTKEQNAVIAELSSGLSKLAKGDLTSKIHAAFPDNYEELRQNFNGALAQLEQTMEGVVAASSKIDSGAASINSASEELSGRTENQAAALEETAAALDQLTVSVKSSADRANEVAETMSETRSNAKGSGQVVIEAVNAMAMIEDSSNEITKITTVIADIAFQTNLLALNAGVEAARAGEAGRGFAVVASEVRLLAQRSSDAAREVAELISKSTSHVSDGTKLINKAGSSLEVVIGKIDQVSQLIAEIASNAMEQATGVSEINIGVNQLDQVTQQNAGMVVASNQQSSDLAIQAQLLEELVKVFQLSKHSSGLPRQQTPDNDFSMSSTARVA